MTVNYRDAYGFHASNGILFNHEGPTRGETFVTRKISQAVAAIELGLQDKLYLGNLHAERDWGHARDYVEGMWMMLQQDEPDDYVLATGEKHSVREFVERAFDHVGRRIAWRGAGVDETGIDAKSGQILVEIDPRYFRPTEVDLLLGDSGKARQKLGWRHKTSFADLVKEMVESDRSEVRLERERDNRQDGVIVAAARVGGIAYNNAFPVDFLADNLAIELNLIGGSFAIGVRKLLFLGSSCIYPRLAPQPMNEDILLTGPLEPTNEWYAVAKIAGVKLVEAYRRQHGADFISLMPTNLYGPGDNYHPQDSHVPAALIRRFHEAKVANSPSVTVWGTGAPRREFLAVDDLADACVFVMKHYSGDEFLKVGTGEDVTIAEFA